MKLSVSVHVSVQAVYSLCSPLNMSECTRQIRRTARFQFERRMLSEDGSWSYPDAEFLANDLIFPRFGRLRKEKVMEANEFYAKCQKCGKYNKCRMCPDWIKFKKEYKGEGRPIIPHRTGSGR